MTKHKHRDPFITCPACRPYQIALVIVALIGAAFLWGTA